MSRVFFDTNLFVYLLEDRGPRGARVGEIVERMSERRDELLTSTLTLAEVLVKPLSTGDLDWADQYEKSRFAALRSARGQNLCAVAQGQNTDTAGCDPTVLCRRCPNAICSSPRMNG